MALQFIESEKRKPKLCVNNHIYYKYKVVDETTYWKCEKFQITKCKARMSTQGERIVSHGKKEHNHVADVAKVECDKILNNIKDTARNTRDSPHVIVSDASVGVSLAIAGRLPSVDCMKKTIRNVRAKENPGPVLPLHRRDIVFPELYTLTENQEIFLMFDSGPQDDRILIFSTRRNLQLLARSSHWYADGTFKVSPPLFAQLYTIHGLRHSNSIPLVYALLPDKTHNTYVRLLGQIKQLEATVNPETILIDYESAIIGAIESEFPGVVVRGCFFHFCQCIFRSIQSNGLQQRYETDADFALTMRYLSALAFVPLNELVQSFDLLLDNNVFPPEAQPVIDYFEDTWIGRPDRRLRRRAPRFAHVMWNCYNSVLENLPKTNNALEGWHRGFQEMVGGNHPNIWKFVNALKKEQSLNELRIEQYHSGQQPPASRKKYRDCAERIRRLILDFDPANDVVPYLRGIAHNITY
ncbi:uncharacterized protein LOC116176146 [Photinus pyralis]|uniref:uncharacterized protein LOC116176146 n=1 Tax=Photinus pyralis TaxID=7054 RepID=UPI0012673BED|nr:uncharacterized protein LOC116176146 [Photinus pyralis]